ncbi:50S ribosomal protein L15e [archaeon]|jgi:large subunit ribosomal protein L15e|nr:50S ribosomal protein L15e [archaeon]MBT3577439.1 50S ribosomal protein L15e [archaeon]MBT6820318.1 50S ribosomal protein L15e [archaeon]MBT7025132.1 50S ribosomal protein L15e [archaeon]MBT7238727.1 50S ribosomal protein L15e [archaeon]
MGITKYLREAWKKPDVKTLRARMIEWRKGNTIVKVEKPLRLDRARALGYKAKKGVVVVRVRLKRGGHKRSRPNKARRTKRLHIRKNLRLNYKEIAEQRVARKFTNMEVLNSYNIGKDGLHYFYEVILVDRASPEIKNDKQLGPLVKAPKGRSLRAITSTSRKARGLRNSPVKAPKVRPSLRANRRRGN